MPQYLYAPRGAGQIVSTSFWANSQVGAEEILDKMGRCSTARWSSYQTAYATQFVPGGFAAGDPDMQSSVTLQFIDITGRAVRIVIPSCPDSFLAADNETFDITNADAAALILSYISWGTNSVGQAINSYFAGARSRTPLAPLTRYF